MCSLGALIFIRLCIAIVDCIFASSFSEISKYSIIVTSFNLDNYPVKSSKTVICPHRRNRIGEGMEWIPRNVACWCILTTSRNNSILANTSPISAFWWLKNSVTFGFPGILRRTHGGMGWNVACWCILTTARNDSILTIMAYFRTSGGQKTLMKLACKCIMTTLRTGSILAQFWPSGGSIKMIVRNLVCTSIIITFKIDRILVTS